MSRWAPLVSLFVCSCAALAPSSLAQAPGGQLDSSPTLFSVLAAINAAGYDEGLRSPNTSPLRAEVRQWVEKRKPASLTDLKRFYAAHRAPSPAADLSQYVTFALTVDGPPNFKPRFPAHLLPPEAAALEGLSAILTRFHQEAELDEAYRRSQPAFEQVIARYHEPVTKAVFDVNAYLRNPTSGIRGRRFQIFVDLLAAPNFVFSRALGDDYFVVVTPSPELRTFDIRHAYLDYLIDPLAIRNASVLDKKKGLGDLAQASPLLAEDYRNDFTRLAGMCLVRAVEARLDRSQGATLVNQSMSEGFILTAHFYEALALYEKQEESFRLYFPKLIDSIDVPKEDKRISQVQFASERVTRVVKAQPPPPDPQLAGPALLADQAEKLYEKRDLASASAKYREVLQQSAPKPVHAKAAFGLARIAVLQNNPELSHQWFERTLELDPEPFERAWTFVYLARLARAARETDAAVKHYQAALAVPGASEGALKAAQTELSSLAAVPSKDP